MRIISFNANGIRSAATKGFLEWFRAQDADSLLSISTNFRSCASILTFVNERFEAVLSADGQPGFTALDPFHDDRGGLCVAAAVLFVLYYPALSGLPIPAWWADALEVLPSFGFY